MRAMVPARLPRTTSSLPVLFTAAWLGLAGCGGAGAGGGDGGDGDGGDGDGGGGDGGVDGPSCAGGTLCGQPAVCCAAGSECIEDQCLPACASGVRCGAMLADCWAAGDVCLSATCATPGAACLDAYDCVQPGEFCEPTLGQCLPQPDPLLCEVVPAFAFPGHGRRRVLRPVILDANR